MGRSSRSDASRNGNCAFSGRRRRRNGRLQILVSDNLGLDDEGWLQRLMGDARSELSPLGTPQPRGLACVTMNAGPDCRRLALLIDIVATITDEGPCVVIGYHVGPEVAPIDMANCDSAAVAIERPRFAGDVAFADEGTQVFGCCSPCRPSIGARLARFGRVDSPRAIGHAIDLKRVAVNHTGGLSEGGRGGERKCSSQGG